MIEMLQSKTFIAQYLTGIWHKEKIFPAQQGDELDGQVFPIHLYF